MLCICILSIKADLVCYENINTHGYLPGIPGRREVSGGALMLRNGTVIRGLPHYSVVRFPSYTFSVTQSISTFQGKYSTLFSRIVSNRKDGFRNQLFVANPPGNFSVFPGDVIGPNPPSYYPFYMWDVVFSEYDYSGENNGVWDIYFGYRTVPTPSLDTSNAT